MQTNVRKKHSHGTLQRPQAYRSLGTSNLAIASAELSILRGVFGARRNRGNDAT